MAEHSKQRHDKHPVQSILASITNALGLRGKQESTLSVSFNESSSILTARFSLPSRYSGMEATLLQGLAVEGIAFSAGPREEDTNSSIIASVDIHDLHELLALRRIVAQTGSSSELIKMEKAIEANRSRPELYTQPFETEGQVIGEYRASFKKDGIAVIPFRDIPLSRAEWFLIESIALRLEPKRAVVDPTYSRTPVLNRGTIAAVQVSELASILKSPALKNLISGVTEQAVTVQDAQINVLKPGEFLSGHTHRFELPFAVLHLNSGYSGGAYFEGPTEKASKKLVIPTGSLVISEGLRYHGVEPVTEGTRYTIPLFMKAERNS